MNRVFLSLHVAWRTRSSPLATPKFQCWGVLIGACFPWPDTFSPPAPHAQMPSPAFQSRCYERICCGSGFFALASSGKDVAAV